MPEKIVSVAKEESAENNDVDVKENLEDQKPAAEDKTK